MIILANYNLSMNADFRALRIKQLARALAPFEAARSVPRPIKGWIAAIRQVSALSQQQIGKKLQITPQAAAHLEKSEAEGKITLKKLREAADAMGCDVVYALVPRNDLLSSEQRKLRAQIRENVTAVEHTMALEDQAVGDIPEKIEEELKRALRNE